MKAFASEKTEAMQLDGFEGGAYLSLSPSPEDFEESWPSAQAEGISSHWCSKSCTVKPLLTAGPPLD